jgi:adenine-specific DNA-methyltransferase
LVAAGLAYFGKNGDGAPSFKQYLVDAAPIVPNTWWPHQDAGHTDEAKKEVQLIFGKDIPFDTPKPERLIHRILTIATNPGDLVLDSFAGSGTTGAVAQKMNRRWIMVELGEHCHTHIIPRLRKVIDGQDPGGVTDATGWTGGGGFRYYRLAPSLLKRDKWGQWVVNREFNPELLAESVCKLEGYTYAPSASTFWQHGKASESAWIYVTTAVLSEGQLRELSADVGPDRSLLVCCGAWLGKASEFDNLTLKKIPKAMLACCEFDRDDYSLNVGKLPVQEPDREPGGYPRARPVGKTKVSKAKKGRDNGLDLFPNEGEA